MTTLDDVAARAGVSTATVSRALTRPNMVAAATLERVQRAVQELGYHHNAAARALATGHTGLIGIAVPTLASSYYLPLISGAQARAEASGYEIVIVDSQGSEPREATLLARLTNRVDALLLAGSRLSDAAIRDIAETLPVATFNRAIPGVSATVIEVTQAFSELGRFLREQGHQRIAYIGGPPGSATDARRMHALRSAFIDDSGDHDPPATSPLNSTQRSVDILGPVAPSFSAGGDLAEQITESGDTAVVAYNSAVALGLMHRLGTLGVRVPEELVLATGDDLVGRALEISHFVTVSQPMAEAGAHLVDLALQQLSTSGSSRQSKFPDPDAASRESQPDCEDATSTDLHFTLHAVANVPSTGGGNELVTR
ncbi:LacI family DNA-binding transcriptional regulator [Saxibacter everestensis]|uniref:LacI family DNA-binding transcriptional regulator n=1 Tax=Saxibacter everestensis TaxID=2909229 RepID=A0ABY8QQE3_9MICO|nr:LacI family DNA-binding transcriptional regulator [Brevibacteriaceae bacterium ZFBP1038]